MPNGEAYAASRGPEPVAPRKGPCSVPSEPDGAAVVVRGAPKGEPPTVSAADWAAGACGGDAMDGAAAPAAVPQVVRFS